MVVMYLLSALLVHFLGCLFGNRQEFSMSFRACVYADAPRFLITILLSIYMAFFVLPGFRANPMSPDEIERAMGLPAGTITGGTTYGSGSPSGFPTRRTTPAKPGKGPASPRPSPTVAPPQPTPEMFLRLAALMWRKLGGIMVASIAFGVIGWLWSTVLLVMAIHRMQRISAGAAIGVVFVMYALGIMLLLLVIFGFAGIILALVNSALHSGGAAAGGGMGR